ncbi:MAG: hypothetical protein Q9220_004192 [cf. Caloplaca sp. 1 TL-2023]
MLIVQAYRQARQLPSESIVPVFSRSQLPARVPLSHRILSTQTRTAIDTAVASKPVVLFMKGTPETPQCGFSRASIQILGLQGVDPNKFAAFNVLEDEELRQGELQSDSPRAPEVDHLRDSGLKEYSDWPTIPQLYLQKEFVGGCDILMSMHQSGELEKMLEAKDVLVPAEKPKD